METKRAACEGDTQLEDARHQLTRYLRGHAETAKMGIAGKAKLYGAVAVGTNVKFFTYRKADGKLNGLHGSGDHMKSGAFVILRSIIMYY